jgi:hypothetical protein
MDSRNAVAVFFVSDAERSLRFYTQQLVFSLDWSHREEGRTFVFQVSLHGFQLILNQVEPWNEGRAGHGRVFLGLKEGEQTEALRRQIEQRKIQTTVIHWGAPTRVIPNCLLIESSRRLSPLLGCPPGCIRPRTQGTKRFGLDSHPV